MRTWSSGRWHGLTRQPGPALPSMHAEDINPGRGFNVACRDPEGSIQPMFDITHSRYKLGYGPKSTWRDIRPA